MENYYPYFILAAIVIFFLALNLFAFIHSRNQPLYSDIFLAIILILFAGLRGADLDFLEYEKMYADIQNSTELSFLQQALIGKDILFGLLLVAMSAVGLGNASVFMISAFLSIGIKIVAFRYAFGSSILGITLYFAFFYFLHDFTQIRLAIALAFCFLSLIFLIKGKYFLYLLFCILAVGFQAQTFLFVVATSPLLTNLKHKYLLVFLSIIVMGLFFTNVAFFLDVVALRPGGAIGAVNLKITAIAAAALNTIILAAAYFGSIGRFKCLFDEEIAKVSVLLFFGGVFFFFITIFTSEVLAWRVYEMFSTFGIFIIIACLRSEPKIITIAAGLSYFIFNFMLLLRSNLLVEYSINNSIIGVLRDIFQ